MNSGFSFLTSPAWFVLLITANSFLLGVNIEQDDWVWTSIAGGALLMSLFGWVVTSADA